MFGPQDAPRGREGSIMAKQRLPEKEAEEGRVDAKSKFGLRVSRCGRGA
jgi:hypothetical protein